MTEMKVINFAAGPAKLPETVLEQAQKELVNFNNTGMSVMEMSHRSSDFIKILDKVELSVRKLLNIPENYKVLFVQGGGTGQFSAIPLNLMRRSAKKSADYIVSGSWSAKAAEEAAKYGSVRRVYPKIKSYTGIPEFSTWELDPEASYVYYCANETVHGVEFHFIPDTGDVPLVCDMSSNIMTAEIDVSKFGLIFAGAQKNIGCAGVTLVIIREDLLGLASPECPIVFDFQTIAGNNSLYNTPPTYGIYIMGLVLDWMTAEGGIAEMQKRSEEKAKIIYDVLDECHPFYRAMVTDSKSRSRMNIPFRLCSKGEADEALEKKFLTEASSRGFVQLKGHRSVGGIRASLYNAITRDEAQTLASFMREFYAKIMMQ